MDILKVGPNRLRIVLSCEDLDKYNLDYFSISTESSTTVMLLNEILSKAKKDGFMAGNCKLLVEVLPDTNNGCILYITKSNRKKSNIHVSVKGINEEKKITANPSYLLTFESLEDAIGAMKRFESYPDLAVKKSRFYKFEKKWYLTFEPVAFGLNGERLVSLLADLSEYGEAESKNSIREAVLEEHGDIIAKSRAIENFIRYFK